MTNPFQFSLIAILWIANSSPAQELLPAPRELPPAFSIPYKLTDTNHVMVRVKLNGKGPFNFILDTGAPALILGEKIAEKVGAKAEKGWADLDKLEIEGGLTVPKAKALVVDMFQLKGMNAMGVAGVELHGVLGYNILARYEITYDFTKDKLAWRPLPGFDPPAIKRLGAETAKDSGQGGLEMIGNLMQTLGPLMGLKANFATRPRGFLGVELEVKDDQLFVKSVVEGGPAAAAGVKAGDRVVAVNRKDTDTVSEARKAVAGLAEAETLRLAVRRGTEDKLFEITLGRGF